MRPEIISRISTAIVYLRELYPLLGKNSHPSYTEKWERVEEINKYAGEMDYKQIQKALKEIKQFFMDILYGEQLSLDFT